MLGFLVKTYPKISETFVLQEILALQSEPFGIHIFALQRPTDDRLHAAFKEVSADVDYLTTENWRTLSCLKSHLRFMFKRPYFYWATLRFALSRPEGGSVAEFCQAVYFADLAQSKGIRHIHTHFATEPTGLAELVNSLCGISYSISAHAKDIYLSDKRSLCRKMAHAQFVVTCTKYNRRYLQSINASDTPIYRVYHGIDEARVMGENDGKLPQSSVIRILSVGRLREKKGFPCLIGACQLLMRAGFKFQCDIVGYGPDREDLEELIGRYQLVGIVRLLGKMTHDELTGLYRQTSIFALPCKITDDGDRDGIPNVLMEAMTFAIPVVSTRVSGIPELIKNGVSGILIEPDNPDALFDALKLLLDHLNWAKQLGIAGKQRIASHFSADQHIGGLKKLIQDVLPSDEFVDFDKATTGVQHGC